MAGLDIDKLEKNFEIFSRGIERLQELEQELKQFEGNGFENEINTIKSKLKNVTEIPTIEREIGELRARMQNNQSQGQKQTTLKQFDKFLNSITKRIEANLHKKIEERHEDFHNRFKNFYKQKISENNTALAQVDFLKKQIKELRQEIATIKQGLGRQPDSIQPDTIQQKQPGSRKLLRKIKKELDRVEEENQEIEIKQDIYYETLQEILERIKRLLETKQGSPDREEKKEEAGEAKNEDGGKQKEDEEIKSLFNEINESDRLE